MSKKYSWYEHFNFFVLDYLCVFLSFLVSFFLRHNSFLFFQSEKYISVLIAFFVFDLLIYFFTNPYTNIFRRGNYIEFKKTLANCLLVTIFVIVYLFIIKIGNSISRITLFLTFILYTISSYISRVVLKKIIQRKAKRSIVCGEKSLLIICKYNETSEIINKIKLNNYDFYRISGFCITDKKKTNGTVDGFKIVADKENLLDYVSSNWVDDIFISNINYLNKKTIKQLSLTGITIHIKIKKMNYMNDKTQTIDHFASYNTICISLKEHTPLEIIGKRFLDVIGGIVGCILLLIIIIVIGPIIYMKSPGNIFYVSDRVGKNGKVFKFYKLRSMVLNADDLKESLKNKNQIKNGMMFKIKNDPRIIPGIGSFIRKTSIDEFPQFYNVLKGDMSLVGTRPPTIEEWKKYSPYYRSRLSMKPGITGLWQVSGRSTITDFEEVVRLDNEYINNWSLDLDIKIILKTVFKLFTGDIGAM